MSAKIENEIRLKEYSRLYYRKDTVIERQRKEKRLSRFTGFPQKDEVFLWEEEPQRSAAAVCESERLKAKFAATSGGF